MSQTLSCIKLNVYFQEESQKKSQINYAKSHISTTFFPFPHSLSYKAAFIDISEGIT